MKASFLAKACFLLIAPVATAAEVSFVEGLSGRYRQRQPRRTQDQDHRPPRQIHPPDPAVPR